MKSSVFGAALGAIAMLAAGTTPVSAQDKDVLGWVEMTRIMPWGIPVKMKLDTGALTSSMQGDKIETFDKDGEKWVRFEVELENEDTGKVEKRSFEKPVFRRVKLQGAGGIDRRYVVLMNVCVGDTIYEEQFSLRDRDKFNYPVLIGRRSIQHWGLIDVTKTFLTEPECDENSILRQYEERDEADEDIGA
ncbi:MAG: ATP-dependent zinc protease [Salinisphaeraceae bacterium]|jgi:hypothetical protein|nr:ATP-dependent zinc protease [Salinisphaeraceae bacterium]